MVPVTLYRNRVTLDLGDLGNIYYPKISLGQVEIDLRYVYLKKSGFTSQPNMGNSKCTKLDM